MKELGFCCGIWYQHESKILTCEKSCNIENNQIYYRYKDWLFCSKCFSKEKQIVNLDLSINLTASKDCFKECIYHEEKDEEIYQM
ncbi:hypothetical protein PVAND_001774 [Polypedilum vanderplanki]|uniref:CREB-binding protein/p300 atypical RING domain-containing protein n=1 Tax=Polypedilum vanderplanki TaxID=319348 RepID=A0A9J6BPF3_POLVA|nr:hypothetical protein PVAND_001774 [Polypedilum vanderplanki]